MTVDVEELDIVSAVWMLASNDETSLITYEGIRYRLDLLPSFDVRNLVRKRGELFRLGANAKHLEAWKEEMLAGRHLPSWIRAITDDAEREKTIKGITVNDVFRSQFRTSRSAGSYPWRADRSPIEIIKWGLEHIDRLRKANLEAREATAKSWQMWLIFGGTVLSIVTQIIIAMVK
jgi:hypothetical protein